MRPPRAPEHRPGLLVRHRRRHALHRDGARGGREPRRDHAQPGREHGRAAHHEALRAGRAGAPLRRGPGSRARRRQARERAPRRQRQREARRLRPLRDAEGHGRDLGHALLHRPREGEEGARRLPCRHVLARRHDLPRAHGRRAVRGRRRERGRPQALRGAAEEAERGPPRHLAADRLPGDEDARAQPGRPLSEFRGAARRLQEGDGHGPERGARRGGGRAGAVRSCSRASASSRSAPRRISSRRSRKGIPRCRPRRSPPPTPRRTGVRA